MASFEDVVRELKSAWNAWERSHPFQDVLYTFVELNELVLQSPNYKHTKADDLNLLAQVLRRVANPMYQKRDLVLLTLKAMKILSRKEINRMHISHVTCATLLEHLNDLEAADIAAEAANLLLNICYERKNVHLALDLQAMEKLERALCSRNEILQMNVAGALQSICFQDIGRCAARKSACIKRLVYLTSSSNERVRLRAVGALHNISSDHKAIQVIRKADGIPRLVKLLKKESDDRVRGSIAGAIQNLSREAASRLSIRQLGAATPLVSLLSSSDTQASVCAAGALINILSSQAVPTEQRKLWDIISSIMVIANVKHSIQQMEAALV